MASTSSGRATKDALSDALVRILSDGNALNKIPIRKITESCGVDRQTFYYHFKNIYDLAEYACKNETAKLFSLEGVDALETLGWREQLEMVMRRIESAPALRDAIIPALGESLLRMRFNTFFSQTLSHDFVPGLIARGFSPDQAQKSGLIVSHILYSFVIDWIVDDDETSAADMLDDLDTLVEDYIKGVELRILRECRAKPASAAS